MRRESEFDPTAVGDNGRARGLWQWHEGSWIHVRRTMGASTEDRRDEPLEATVTALWWIKQGYGHWWTADRYCRPQEHHGQAMGLAQANGDAVCQE